jgi:hypothetical protein
VADSKVILDKEIITVSQTQTGKWECGKHAIACDVGYVEWKSFIEYQTQTDLYTCLVYITYIIRNKARIYKDPSHR